MTKKNNRGFSLIEIVIAIAVLSLLLSPIIIQLVQSIRVNAQAKEKQYVVENAEYLLEYVQRTDISFDDNSEDLGVDGVVEIPSDPEIKDVKCEVYDRNLNYLGYVDYRVKSYELETETLGRYQNEYSRTVAIDNLANKLLANKFDVIYDGFSETEITNLQDDGFEFTNEGNCVKYTDGFVTAIVCDENNVIDPSLTYQDPNMVNLGYVQNLKTDRVAIIQGVASNPDANVTDVFYAMKMAHLKVLDKASWEQAMTTSVGSTIFDTVGFTDTLRKVTKISITSGPLGADNKPTYYDVTCDLYYSDKYNMYIDNIDPEKFVNTNTTSMEIVTAADGKEAVAVVDVLKYSVFSQRFYTAEAPDIYFVYEPFVESYTSTGIDRYVPNDYITISNDKGSEDAKVYLVKPVNTAGNPVADNDAAAGDMEDDARTYANVTIHLNHITSKSTTDSGDDEAAPADGEASDEDEDNTVKQLNVFTNLKNIDTQFSLADFSVSLDTFTKMNVIDDTQKLMAYEGVKAIEDDVREQGRLYTVTVTLKRTDGQGDTVTFTGAKGAN